MTDSLERLARNQALFREVNERIEDIARSGDGLEFVCECSDPECVSTVKLSLAEYERIRSESTWFFVKSGHVIPEIERVVFVEDGYAVVEKMVGREFAKEADPRTGDPS